MVYVVRRQVVLLVHGPTRGKSKHGPPLGAQKHSCCLPIHASSYVASRILPYAHCGQRFPYLKRSLLRS